MKRGLHFDVENDSLLRVVNAKDYPPARDANDMFFHRLDENSSYASSGDHY